MRVVASGVDALYLSGLVEELPRDLVAGMELAREQARRDDNPVEFVLGGVPVAMHSGPFGRYRYRLDHENALIGFTEKHSLPAVRAQFRAKFLHAVGVELALDWLYLVMKSAGVEPVWTVSRLDLFADVQGWPLVAEDRRSFVARADKRQMHEEGEDLTGLRWGTGGSVLCRIYDKTREIGVSGSDYWPAVWAKSGSFDPTARVERVEFQITRDFLRERNLNDPETVMLARHGIWKYLTHEWLSLRVASADSNRSRWRIASAWNVIQGADLNGAPVGIEVVRDAERAGDALRLVPMFVGYGTSLTASQGGETEEDLFETLRWACDFYERRTGTLVEDLLAVKRLKFGLT